MTQQARAGRESLHQRGFFSRDYGQNTTSAVETQSFLFQSSFPSPWLLLDLYSGHFMWDEGALSAVKVLPPLGEHLTPPWPHLDFASAVQPHQHLLLPGDGDQTEMSCGWHLMWDPAAMAEMPACTVNLQLPYPLQLTLLQVHRKKAK